MFSFRFEFWVSIILDSLLLWQVLDTPEFTRNPDIEEKNFGETNWKKLLENWAKQPTPSLVEGVSLEFSPAYPNFMTLLTILSCIAELSKGWFFFLFCEQKWDENWGYTIRYPMENNCFQQNSCNRSRPSSIFSFFAQAYG